MRQKFTFLIYVLTFVAAFQDLLAEKMSCLGDPPKMENGNAVIDFRLHGHYISYKCHEGTIRTKIGNVQCHDGAWIGYPAKCELLPCLLDPPNIENGRAVIDKRHHGHYIRYECQSGDKTFKVGSIQCLNGTWKGETPNCDFPDCTTEDLRFFNIVIPFQESVEHSKSIDVECKEGFRPTENEQVITCIKGEWNITEDPCIDENIQNESCQSDPPIVENGRAIIENRNHGTYIIYECHPYADRSTPGSVHCHNGIWKGKLPKCEFDACSWDPPKFENAKAVTEKKDMASDEEFADVDKKQKTSFTEFRYNHYTCFYGPPKVENGRPVIEKRDHGHYIWYECLGGSKKTEEGNVHCRNTFWKGKPPKCEFPVCLTKDLNFTNLITPVQESVESSKSLEVHCKEGYRPARNAQVITCMSGEWNITEDPCIEENTFTDADCMAEDLSNFNLVTPFQDSVESSKSLDVQCKEGYKPARKVITCMNGAWDITADPCIEENIINEPCLGDPPEIENGRAVIIDRDHGYFVWYKCEEGTIRTKFGDVRCKYGNWVGSPPRCAYPVCLTRDLYYPSMVMPLKEFVQSSTSIDIVCKEGYKPSTYAKVITCMGGEWNITQDPCIEEKVSADTGYIPERDPFPEPDFIAPEKTRDKFEDVFRVMTTKSFRYDLED